MEEQGEKIAFLMTKEQASKISMFAAVGGMVIGSIGYGKGKLQGNQKLTETLMLAQIVALQEAMSFKEMGTEKAKEFEKSVMEVLFELGGKDLEKDGLGKMLDFGLEDEGEDHSDDWKGEKR